MVKMVEILKVVITNTVKILSTIVEMVEILKVVINYRYSKKYFLPG